MKGEVDPQMTESDADGQKAKGQTAAGRIVERPGWTDKWTIPE